jgi:hypothetical protein
MILFIAFFYLYLLNGCHSQTSNEQVYSTSQRVIDALREGNAHKFISLIGFDDLRSISKTEEMVTQDVSKIKDLFKRYFPNAEPKIEITELYNRLGQKLVRVPFYKRNDSATIKGLHLNLLFGPPNMVSLNMISRYELVKNNTDSLDFHPFSYWR